VSWSDAEIEAFEDIYGAAHTPCEYCQEDEGICLRSLCLHPETCDLPEAVIPSSEMVFSAGIRARVHAGCCDAWERGDEAPASKPPVSLFDQMRSVDLKYAGIEECQRLVRQVSK
jgi:hypothetical protein